MILNPNLAQELCGFPDRIHPVSARIMDYFVSGSIEAPTFLRFFSLPNSDYIPLARCFIDMVTGALPLLA